VDIVKAVAEDPYGVGLVGTYQAKSLPSAVKLYRSPRGRPVYSTAGYNDVLAGNYPFSAFLHLYAHRVPERRSTHW